MISVTYEAGYFRFFIVFIVIGLPIFL